MAIAAEVCVFTNDRLTIETIEADMIQAASVRRDVIRSSIGFLIGSGPRAHCLSGCATVRVAEAAAARFRRSRSMTRGSSGPSRASGPIARRASSSGAKALGDKALVHNYGHGGAGITLSWGSSRARDDLGFRDTARSGRSNRQRGHGSDHCAAGAGSRIPVTIYTAALPPDTTSAWPAARCRRSAISARMRLRPRDGAQFAAAMAYSWKRFQILVGERYGVRWLPTYEETPQPVSPTTGSMPIIPMARAAPGEHPFPVEAIVLRHHVRRDAALPGPAVQPTS